MNTVIFFIFACFVGSGFMFMALMNTQPNESMTMGIVGSIIWLLFFIHVGKKARRREKRKERERLFDEWLRSQNKTKYND